MNLLIGRQESQCQRVVRLGRNPARTVQHRRDQPLVALPQRNANLIQQITRAGRAGRLGRWLRFRLGALRSWTRRRRRTLILLSRGRTLALTWGAGQVSGRLLLSPLTLTALTVWLSLTALTVRLSLPTLTILPLLALWSLLLYRCCHLDRRWTVHDRRQRQLQRQRLIRIATHICL